MKKIIIKFDSIKDFNDRITKLWQDQKEDEFYKFIFPDKETEDAFNNLIKDFAEGQQGASHDL